MTTSNRVEFTTEMKRDYTILVPNMAPIHFGLLRNVFINYGYRMEILQNDGRAVVDAGLKYVHNDICYPPCWSSASSSTRFRAAATTRTRSR